MVTFDAPKMNRYIHVKLDGVPVGTIKEVSGGFRYFPKGSLNGGEVFTTVMQCKRSLTGE